MHKGSIPVIRLEVESMKWSILKAFTEANAKIDADIRRAVEAFCTPENVQRVVSRTVNEVLTQVIDEEVRSFYRYGDGRKIVKAAIERKLKRKQTDLDD